MSVLSTAEVCEMSDCADWVGERFFFVGISQQYILDSVIESYKRKMSMPCESLIVCGT